MSLMRYRNELIVLVALLLALGAYWYKSAVLHRVEVASVTSAKEVNLLEETVALKKLWGDKGISKKVEALHTLVSDEKVKWEKRGKKLHATYSNLKPSELNKVVTKLLSLPVQIVLFDLKKEDSSYRLEIKCKW